MEMGIRLQWLKRHQNLAETNLTRKKNGRRDVMAAKTRFFWVFYRTLIYRTLCNVITRRILPKDERDITHNVKNVTPISELVSILFIYFYPGATMWIIPIVLHKTKACISFLLLKEEEQEKDKKKIPVRYE